MVLKKLLPFGGSDDEEQSDEEKDPDDVEIGEGVDSVEDLNKQLVASQFINEKRNRMLVGGQWTRTYFTNNWPEEPENQFLNEAFNTPAASSDISIHIEPEDEGDALDELQTVLRRLRQKVGSEQDVVRQQDRREKIQKVEGMIETLRSTETSIFEVSMYTTVRSDNEEELQMDSERITTQMESAPALTDQQIPAYAQMDALKSVSPVAKDYMYEENENFDTRTKMMGGAIAAMLPFTSKTLIEENGVEFGIQSANGSPVIVDRWDRGNGYNQLTIGTIGAGKSFSTKLNILRTYAKYDDVIIFMLDPLRGFTKITDHLNGEHIPVGGGKTLNPMEISAPDDPEEVKGDADPYGQKVKSVKNFLRTFLRLREKGVGDEMEQIADAIDRAYRNNGITPDPTTHDNPSPSLKDVMDILIDMSNNPEKFAETESDAEVNKIESRATDAVFKLQEFQEGRELDYLSGETEIDLYSNDVIYLDLHQQEGSGELGLMMQVLFEQVYQRAKETDKKVLFCLDEAHYIMGSSDSLDFLAQAVRHSRHYDLSLNFITQTAREFLVNDKAEDIADNCVIKLFHKTKDLDADAGEKLGLNPPAIQHVRTAKEGDPDRGYSEALIGVEGDFMPIRVYASDFEQMIVEMSREEIVRELSDTETI